MLALLGFSTACSGVKNGPKDGGKSGQSTTEQTPIVMYGVRVPEGTTSEIGDMKKTVPAEDAQLEIETTTLQEKE